MKSEKSKLSPKPFEFDEGPLPNNAFESAEGVIELWVLVFGQSKHGDVILRMPYPMSPMVKVKQLQRGRPELAYLSTWTSTRKPKQGEVRKYVAKHPELKIVVDETRIKTLDL